MWWRWPPWSCLWRCTSLSYSACLWCSISTVCPVWLLSTGRLWMVLMFYIGGRRMRVWGMKPSNLELEYVNLLVIIFIFTIKLLENRFFFCIFMNIFVIFARLVIILISIAIFCITNYCILFKNYNAILKNLKILLFCFKNFVFLSSFSIFTGFAKEKHIFA